MCSKPVAAVTHCPRQPHCQEEFGALPESWPPLAFEKSKHGFKYSDSIGISLVPECIPALSLVKVTTRNEWLVVAGIRDCIQQLQKEIPEKCNLTTR